MLDYCELAVPGVRALHPYQPGKPIEELQRELGLEKVVKLASNENPLGPSQAVLKVIAEHLPELTRYPDGNGFELKTALAKKLKVEPVQLTLGNGSNDVLEMIARTFAQTGDEIVFSEYAFAVYPIVTQAVGASAKVVAAQDWGHDLDGMLKAINDRTRVVFIANPNNPTGTWLTEAQLVPFLNKVPENVIIVLDEAYFEYASHESSEIDNYPDGIRLLPQFPNLIVTRTFSKAYGLAGLRAGYSVSSPVIANLLNRVRQPFNTNLLALVAATAVLGDAEYLEKGILLNRSGMTQIESEFQSMGIGFIPSAGNFISFDLKREAAPVYAELLKHGVIVRPIANYGMPDHLRVSIGNTEENQIFISALKKVLS